MNYGSSNAKVIEERKYECAAEMKRGVNKRKSDMFRQRIWGLLLISAAVLANFLADDMELILAFIPAGLFLIFTKKNIMTF